MKIYTSAISLVLVLVGIGGLFTEALGPLPTNLWHATLLNLLPGAVGLVCVWQRLEALYLLGLGLGLVGVASYGLVHGDAWLYPFFNMNTLSSYVELGLGLFVLAFYVGARRGVKPPPHPFAASLEKMKIGGSEVAYLDVGAGEPVVLLHGYPESMYSWHKIIPELSERYRVLAFDWPGWGASPKDLEAPAGYEADTAVLEGFLDALDLERVHLVCYDYGGFIGLGFAEAHPERLQTLALHNSRSHRTFPFPIGHAFGWVCVLGKSALGRTLVSLLPLEPVHRLGMRLEGRGCFSASDLDHYLNWMIHPSGKYWLAHFFGHYTLAVRPELGANLSRITCPTLITWTDRDPWCPLIVAQELEAGIPDARLHVIEGGHHFLLEEKAEDVARELVAFLPDANPG